MIQDISPYRLDTAYRDTVPAPDDRFFSFQGEDVLLREGEDGCRSLPSFRDLQYPAGGMPRQAVFLFRVDKEPVFLLDGAAPGCRGLRYLPVCGLKGILPGWAFFTGVTALHLNHWYGNNRYCGRCGSAVEKKMGQRALVCPDCGNTVYPCIAPVVMVAVINGDKLLMPRMTLTRWKWMMRKIFLDRHIGAAGDCRPSSKANTQEGAMKWDES